MDTIVLDFETHYSPTYSLSKITTEEYVRHELFEVIGVAVKVNDGETQWFSGTHEEVKDFLSTFNWGDAAAVAHNAAFDMAILSWHFDIRPKRIIDTLSMARALHGTEVGGSLKTLAEYYEIGVKGTEVVAALGFRREDFTPEGLEAYGGYCKNDVELTYSLLSRLIGGFPDSELRLIDLTIRMFTEPRLVLDAAILTAHLKKVQYDKHSLMEKVNNSRDELMSNPKLAEVLIGLGVEPPMKKSPATGKETFAFAKQDEEFKALLEHENVLVQTIVAARLGVRSTMEETRTTRFIGIAQRGPLPVPLRYYAAHTGRWGGSDKINVQNLGKKSPLKNSICAPEGYVIIDADSSQIEARTLAWLAEQHDLVKAFDAGEDVYKIMAAAIYNKPQEDITTAERFVGKTVVLGCGYGLGSARFRVQMKTFGVDMSEAESASTIATYRKTYPSIPELWRKAGKALEALATTHEENRTVVVGRKGALFVEGHNGIKLPNGLYIHYPNLRLTDNPEEPDGGQEWIYEVRKGRSVTQTRIYGAKAVENLTQALARIVIGEQMLLVAKRYPVVMTVHDAIACVAPEEEAEEAQAFVEACMRTRPVWAPDLPLNCESGYGRSYGDC